MIFDKVLTYSKLIPKALSNFPHVVQGIINDVKLKYNALPDEEQDEIIKRRMICESCPFNSKNAQQSIEYRQLFEGKFYKPDAGREDLHCSICDCNIDWKTASLSEKCGLSYYNDIYPNNKQELKWDVFKNQKTNG